MSNDRRHEKGVLFRFSRAYLARRYAILFYSLLVTLAAGPFLDAFSVEVSVVEALLAVNLAAAIVPLAAGVVRRVLLGLFIVTWIVWIGGAWLGRPTVSAASFGVWAIIAVLAVASALQFALRARVIDREHLYAALDAYVLFGLFMGVGYWALESLAPGSFHLTTAAAGGDGGFSLPTAVYFSFVTLATLGYGDVVPVSEAARGIAIVQAMSGQLYLAVMIARLVSLYGRDEPPRPRAED
jgi:hypothetical protein